MTLVAWLEEAAGAGILGEWTAIGSFEDEVRRGGVWGTIYRFLLGEARRARERRG